LTGWDRCATRPADQAVQLVIDVASGAVDDVNDIAKRLAVQPDAS
jgi:hypothetical protein